MPNTTAQILASDNGPWTQMRTGTITAQDATFATVLVGGTQVQAAYEFGANFTEGDLVIVLRQDATWAVLYRIAGSGPNEIQNPSFEMSPTGQPPILWFLADIVGVSQSVVSDELAAPEGTQYAQVFSDAAAATSYLYSSPIAATAGDIFNVSAFVTGIYDTAAAQTADAALVATWYADSDDLYPTTSSADIVVTTFADVPSGPPFVQLSGSVTAPVTGFLRLALRTTIVALNQSLGWDFATARRVG